MSKTLIRFSSVTYAIRAQRVLEQHGIRSYVKRVSKGMQVSGCGYGLEITGDANTSTQLITAAGIRIVEVVPAA